MTYLRVEVRGDYTPYHCNRLDGQSIGMLRVYVASIEVDGWSLRSVYFIIIYIRFSMVALSQIFGFPVVLIPRRIPGSPDPRIRGSPYIGSRIPYPVSRIPDSSPRLPDSPTPRLPDFPASYIPHHPASHIFSICL